MVIGAVTKGSQRFKVNIWNGQTVKVLPTVLSSEGHENFPEVVPVIAEIPLALPSSNGCGKLRSGSEMALLKWDLRSTGTTVWFTVEYCHYYLTIMPSTKITCTRERGTTCLHYLSHSPTNPWLHTSYFAWRGGLVARSDQGTGLKNTQRWHHLTGHANTCLWDPLVAGINITWILKGNCHVNDNTNVECTTTRYEPTPSMEHVGLSALSVCSSFRGKTRSHPLSLSYWAYRVVHS